MNHEISIELIKKGYQAGILRFEAEPDGDDTVCHIGDYWFYFDTDAEFATPEEYFKKKSLDDIFKAVYDQLVEFGELFEFQYEHEYYYCCLNENPLTGAEEYNLLDSWSEGNVHYRLLQSVKDEADVIVIRNGNDVIEFDHIPSRDVVLADYKDREILTAEEKAASATPSSI